MHRLKDEVKEVEETLKEQIKESIKAQKDMEVENKYVDDLLEAVAKNVEVDVPQAMVDEETDRLVGRFEEQMKMQGISLDLYYQFTQSNEEALRSQMEKEAYNNVLYRLMLEQIMTEEKIEVTKEEALKEAEELANKYQMDKAEFLKQFGGLDMVQYDLEVRKTIELLKETGIVKNERDGIKILGNGELTKKLTVQANKFSASAVEKIEAMGGKAEVI